MASFGTKRTNSQTYQIFNISILIGTECGVIMTKEFFRPHSFGAQHKVKIAGLVIMMYLRIKFCNSML